MQDLRKILLILVPFLVFFSFSCDAKSRSLENLSTKSTFFIISVHANKCLDVRDRSYDNWAQVQLWDCFDLANQKIRLIRTIKKNIFEIVFLHSSKCLDVAGNGDGNGASIIQYDCHHGPSERFKLVPDGDGYQLQTTHGKCVDVSQWHKNNGAEIIQYDCHGGDNQKFLLRSVGEFKAEENICQALGKLHTAHDSLKDLQKKISDLNRFRAEICDKVLPADEHLRKLRNDIERTKADIKGSPTITEQNAINEQVLRHNKKNEEITPKLDRWISEYGSIDRIFLLSKRSFEESLEALNEALHDYLDAVIANSIASGDAEISGLTDFDVEICDEDKLRECVSNRIDTMRDAFHGQLSMDIGQWKDQCSPFIRERINSVFKGFLGLHSPLVSGVLQTCIRRLDIPKLFEALFVNACLKNILTNEL